MIQYQIPQTDIKRTVWEIVRRITNEILGVKGLKLSPGLSLAQLLILVMFRYWTKRTNKNGYLQLDGPSKFKEIDSRELQNVHLKWNRKQRKQVLFRVVVSLHPPGGNIFVLSRNSTATLQQMCPWLLERLPVNHFELFESLNFESVQDVKAKFPHNPILHYASIYGALLFSVCACIMNKGVSF